MANSSGLLLFLFHCEFPRSYICRSCVQHAPGTQSLCPALDLPSLPECALSAIYSTWDGQQEWVQISHSQYRCTNTNQRYHRVLLLHCKLKFIITINRSCTYCESEVFLLVLVSSARLMIFTKDIVEKYIRQKLSIRWHKTTLINRGQEWKGSIERQWVSTCWTSSVYI